MPDPTNQVEQYANFLSRRGLRSPALFFLELGQPLLFLGGQFLWVAQPALSLIWQSEQIQAIAELLEDKTAVAALSQRLASKDTVS